MIDVNFLVKQVMRHNLYSESELMNKSARQVLAELKTKYVDIKEEITANIQYKLLTKMLNDRIKAAEIYNKANRTDLEEKELSEIYVIKSLISEVEKDLPKQMTEDEIIKKINDIILHNPNANIGLIMKEFKDLPADKAFVSKIAKAALT